MRAYFSTLIIGCALVAGFIYWADPANRWHRAPVMLERPLKKGEAYVHPADLDERVQKLNQLRLTPRPELVYLGSSRVMLVDAAMTPGSSAVLNLGVSGASVEDYVGFWEALKEQNKVPAYVAIFADPWVFNENSGQGRWRSLGAYVQRFNRDAKLLAPSSGIFLEAREAWDNFTELLSWVNLKAAWHYYRDPQRTVAEPSHGYAIMSEREVPAKAIATRWDGSHVYPAAQVVPPTPAEARKKQLEYASMKDVYSVMRWVPSESAVQTLRRLIDDMRAQGTRVLLVAPPYPRVVLDALAHRAGYERVIPDYLEILQRLARNLASDRDYCNRVDSAALGCAATDFMDGMHTLRGCSEAMVRSCFTQSPEFKGLLGAGQSAGL